MVLEGRYESVNTVNLTVSHVAPLSPSNLDYFVIPHHLLFHHLLGLHGNPWNCRCVPDGLITLAKGIAKGQLIDLELRCGSEDQKLIREASCTNLLQAL